MKTHSTTMESKKRDNKGGWDGTRKPKVPKLHKETKRITGAIKKGGEPTFASKVNVGSIKNFRLVATQVAEACPGTVVMLGAIVETTPKKLFIAAIVPEDVELNGEDWLHLSIACGATKDATIAPEAIAKEKTLVNLVSLVYNAESEQTPFTMVDQVIGVGTAHLKKIGVYPEEEEEYEYGFDDI